MTKLRLLRIAVALVAGLFFGLGMIVSEMVNPAKVIGFLDITGNWDPSLIFVMGGALAVFTPIYHLLIKKRSKALNGDPFSCPSSTKIDGRLISGALIFGAGWGLAGFCPGPAITNIGGGSYTVLAFIFSMIIGMILATHYQKSRTALSFLAYRKSSHS